MVLQLHLFFGLIFSSNIWFRDLLREFDKKYEVLLIIFFLLFLLFLVSEGLLFVSFFWTSFHSLSSSTLGIWPGEGFYLPDPCELTFANTLLLSNAAISLGNAFISLEISSQFYIFFSLFSFILAWTFISLQIKEFRIMGLSINDSVYSCVFFFLTGLHFFHLLVSLLLLSLLLWSCGFSSLKPVSLLVFSGSFFKKTILILISVDKSCCGSKIKGIHNEKRFLPDKSSILSCGHLFYLFLILFFSILPCVSLLFHIEILFLGSFFLVLPLHKFVDS